MDNSLVGHMINFAPHTYMSSSVWRWVTNIP